ncbi:MAG: SPFH domain-containing protein [Dysgonamonadaceae bacterium]|jgi:membrane protease subunit (stomatin/prohibitin family)|nr:SPFH domain-containing protein [Dysgonamonadaceae bacterium]
MSIFGKIKEKAFNEFIDIIEWLDDTQDTIAWRFPRYQNEIKNGAQLTVRETQVAVLVDEGKFADVYQPGRHELTTANMPILTTIRGWKYGFNSPFKVEVYFVNTKQFLNLKWGTKNPIMLRDPEFGPIRMRAFGTYCFKVSNDPREFLKQVVGTDGNFTTEGIQEQLRNFILTKFTDHLAEARIPALDIASNLVEFSAALQETLKVDFEGLGVELTKFLLENVSLPEEVEKALDRRTSMGILQNMTQYTQFQFAEALKAGAENPAGGGSPAGDAMGMGMGFAMAGQMAQQMMNQPSAQAATPPPIPQAKTYFVAVNGQQTGPFGLQQLQLMATQGQLTPQSLVWTQGMAAWTSASDIAELGNVFSTVPPPVPSAAP